MQSIIACVLVLAMASQARWVNPGFRMAGFGGYYPMASVPHDVPFSSLAYTGVPVAAFPSYNGVPSFTSSQYHAQNEMGQARFGYAYPGQASSNSRDAMGNQIGSYSYFNPEGKEVRFSYTADHRGFRVLSNYLPVAPVQVQDTPEVAHAKAAHFAAHAEARAALAAARTASAAPKPVAPATVPVVAAADSVVAAADPVSVVAIVESPVAGVEDTLAFDALSTAVVADSVDSVASPSNSISVVVEPDVVVAEPVASASESVAIIAEPIAAVSLFVEVDAESIAAASESAAPAAEPVKDASPAIEVDAEPIAIASESAVVVEDEPVASEAVSMSAVAAEEATPN